MEPWLQWTRHGNRYRLSLYDFQQKNVTIVFMVMMKFFEGLYHINYQYRSGYVTHQRYFIEKSLF